MSASQQSRSWLPSRRWFQFRLRTLLLVTTLVAVALSFVSRPLARYYRERPAVALVNGLGGTIQFEHVPALGESLFSRVLGDQVYLVPVEVDLGGSAVEVADTQTLLLLEHLRRLSLAETGITDAGLEHVGQMHGLASLDLRDTQVTDAGLPALESLQNLRNLHLAGTAVSYEAIARLDEALPATVDLVVKRAVDELLRAGACAVWIDEQNDAEPSSRVVFESLVGGRANVAGEGLRHLAYLPRLRGLALKGGQITDAILACIPELPELVDLDLSSSQVTNAGMANLVRLKSLEVLDLHGTQIDDEGLEHLAVLRGLEWLNLSMTRVTGSGMAQLKKLPVLEDLIMEGVELVYDCDLAHLEDSLSLETLNLSRARVVGPGLRHLAGLPNLRSVTLAGDWADQGAVDRFRSERKLRWGEVKLHAGPAPRAVDVGGPTLLVSKEAEQCFWSGDYERLVDVLAPSKSGSATEWADSVRLGHAHRLLGDVEAAVAAYHDAMDVFGQEIADMPSDPAKASKQRHRRQLVDRWAGLVLLIGQLELEDLDDPAAAIRTLSEGCRFLPGAMRPVPELIATTATALDGLESPASKRPGNSRSAAWATYPMATQTVLARAHERRGSVAAALECWTRLRLSRLARRTWVAPPVDPCHVARLWAKLNPEDSPAAMPLFVHVSQEHPSATIRPDRGDSRLAWWGSGNGGWNVFGVVPPPGKVLARVKLTCEAREPDQASVGPLFCWIGAHNTAAPGAVWLIERQWTKEIPAGSRGDSVEFDVPYDADVMFIQFASEPVRFVGYPTCVGGPCAVRLGGDLYLPAGKRAAWLLKADWEEMLGKTTDSNIEYRTGNVE